MTAHGLVERAQDKFRIWEAYNHFLQAYAHRTLGVSFSSLENVVSDMKNGMKIQIVGRAFSGSVKTAFCCRKGSVS